MKIALLEDLGIPASVLNGYQNTLKGMGHTLEVYKKTQDEEMLMSEAADAGAVMLGNMPISERVVQGFDSVKYIDIAFTGVDHVAVAVAKKKGIKLSNASGYATDAVAELTIAQTLALLRDTQSAQARCAAGQDKAGLRGFELKGKCVGLLGYGAIGRRAAELFLAFGCCTMATSAHKTAGNDGKVTFVPFEELLKNADILSLHCPLNDSTRGLMDARAFSLMKKTALLINMARGAVVDTPALIAALKNGDIAGAALDVFDIEPPLDKDDPILSAPHVLLTPHIAFFTEESMLKRAEIAFQNLYAFLRGEHVNPV